MRCITIRAPWADLIAHGVKWFECRSWRTDWRGPVVIHAAVRDTDNDPSIPNEAWDALGDVIGGDAPTRGAVVAVADLTDCLPIVDIVEAEHQPGRYIERGPSYLHLWRPPESGFISDQLPLGHWEPGNWAWRLENIRRLARPVPAMGKQGLWRPDADLTAAIEAALPETTP